MVLILLLNHQVKPGAHGAWLMFLNLFGYYGPAWFFFILIAFFIGQFFSVRRYPIGFIRPPTLIYVFSFTILVLSVIIYLNWNFYHDFFSPAVTLKFFLLLAGNTLLVLAGGLFALLHGRRKTWLLVLFGALLTVQVLVNLQLVASRHESQPLPSAYSGCQRIPAQAYDRDHGRALAEHASDHGG